MSSLFLVGGHFVVYFICKHGRQTGQPARILYQLVSQDWGWTMDKIGLVRNLSEL